MKQKKLLLSLASIILAGLTYAQLPVSNKDEVALPAHYFRLMESGIAIVEKRLADEPDATLASLESQPGWIHFPLDHIVESFQAPSKRSPSPAYGGI